MSEIRRAKKLVATAVIFGLFLLVLYGILPFLTGIFGALILSSLFYPIHKRFSRYVPAWFSSISMIVLSVIIVLIPFVIVLSLLAVEINSFVNSDIPFGGMISSIQQYVPSLDLNESISELVKNSGTFLRGLAIQVLGGISSAIVSITVMYFLMFYMLLETPRLKKILHEWTPFNPKNSTKLVQEFINITNTTVIGTGLIAVLQGVLLGVGFVVLGIPQALLWGFVGAIASFLPAVGVVLIWLPAGIIMLALGNVFAGVGILVWGAIISSIDNFLRPVLNDKLGKLHPLLTLVGVFIGLPLFGILGIIIGPLILSYFFLMVRMFKEEYL